MALLLHGRSYSVMLITPRRACLGLLPMDSHALTPDVQMSRAVACCRAAPEAL
jgi:hypothetical protein